MILGAFWIYVYYGLRQLIREWYQKMEAISIRPVTIDKNKYNAQVVSVTNAINKNSFDIVLTTFDYYKLTRHMSYTIIINEILR